MKFSFNLAPDLMDGIERLCSVLGFEIGEGIRVNSVCADRIGVQLSRGVATVYYRDKHHFFRELGILVHKARTETEFSHFDDGYYTCIGAMLDVARNQARSVKAIKKQLDYLAVMGYSSLMLYLEDMVELPSRPYFGYMRGRYTVKELREIDDYAASYGIEVIAAVQCYGHMDNYLIWREAAPIKDTDGVLLARSEDTFAFVDELIATVSGALRTRRVHIGMDEAWDMGRGKFLTKHGDVPPVEIFNEYMARIVEICNKHGVTPLMWSDMYFRVETDNNAYYSPDTVISERTKRSIPEGVELVYWHYGEEPGCDDYMLKKHAELNRKVIFAGGAWTWAGHMPENHYMMQSMRASLEACRKNGVREIYDTLWDDQAEFPLFTALFSLSFTAELAYRENPDEEYLKDRFEASVGGSWDAFLDMSAYNNIFDREHEGDYASFHDRFLGTPLFWQDILSGLYDTHLVGRGMSEHYRRYAEKMAGYVGRDKWSYLYEFAAKIFEYLAAKTYVAENLKSAYDASDKAMLEALKNEYLPKVASLADELRILHRDIWLADNKAFGLSFVETRYTSVRARVESAVYLIDAYLNGEIDAIEELEEKRLHRPLTGFPRYSKIAIVGARK